MAMNCAAQENKNYCPVENLDELICDNGRLTNCGECRPSRPLELTCELITTLLQQSRINHTFDDGISNHWIQNRV
jgi:hypothetical protein